MPLFVPLVPNPHALTIMGNFWPRDYDFSPYPMSRDLVRTDGDTEVLVQTQKPVGEARGEVVLLHGLEGGGDAGYIRSMAYRALTAGFVAHRFHMRTCGGTERLCKTLYHAGLTSDLRSFLEQTDGSGLPRYLVGYSLGGNVALKLAGELGETRLIQGVCTVSTPIDLAMAARRIGMPDNILYERRFVARMKKRILGTGRYSPEQLAAYRTLYAIDDHITAPSFGFGTADNYYATQSARNFLPQVRVPALLIQSKDDTFIPFEMYRDPAIPANPLLRLVATDRGGHLGYLSRHAPRFWADELVVEFLSNL
jgi:predicted alpha/beta-fold hydrolase